MPYLIAFKDVQVGDDWWYVDTLVDILFFCDIMIILNTALVIDERLVTDRKTIFMKYLRGALIIDVLAIFPFDLVT
jgi:hypothetical protein